MYQRIESTDLSRKQKGILLGLFARAADGVHADLSWEDAQELFECGSKAAIRRHLTAFRDAGLVDFHTNAAIHVRFVRTDYESARSHYEPTRSEYEPDPGPESTPNTDEEGDAQSVRIDSQPVRTDSYSERVDSYSLRTGGDYRGGMDGWMDHFSSRGRDPSNPIQSTKDQTRNVEMLTDPDIALRADVARVIASVVPAQDIFRQCVRYLQDKRGGVVQGSGALIHRLAHPEDWPPQPVDDRGRDLAFSRRHGDGLLEDKYAPDEFSVINS